jgi:hypothetical protein
MIRKYQRAAKLKAKMRKAREERLTQHAQERVTDRRGWQSMVAQYRKGKNAV